MPAVDKATCLVLVLDIGTLLTKHQESVPNVLDHVTLFCNSYRVMHRNNQFVLLLSSGTSKSIDLDTDTISLVAKVQGKSGTPCFEARSLSRCLSSALCIINKRHSSSFQFRILVLQFDRDVAVNYNGVMNSIFR